LGARGPRVRVGGVLATWPLPWAATEPLSAALAAATTAALPLSWLPPAELAVAPVASASSPTLFGEVATLRGWSTSRTRPLHAATTAATDRDRSLRQASDAASVLRMALAYEQPAYDRACHVLAAPLSLARAFPQLLSPSAYSTDGFVRGLHGGNEDDDDHRDGRVEACGALARLQTSTASVPYLEGVRAAWSAATARPSVGHTHDVDDVHEVAETLQSLVDAYDDSA
jgi:hypothetical protein